MNFSSEKEKLTLSNFAKGDMEKEFQKVYREVLGDIKGKEKGTITLTITLQRIENTDMMVDTSFTIKKAVPARAKKAMAIITDDGILTEKPKDPPVKLVTPLFGDKEVKTDER